MNLKEKFEVFEEFSKMALLTAGTEDDYNTMTIGWGNLGTMWNKPACTVYVRISRYTMEFMEKNDYFTVSFFEGNKEDLAYLGSHSGREGDKVARTSLTPMEVPHGMSFREAKKTLVCRKMYKQLMDAEAFEPEVKKAFYSGANEKDLHYMFIGEVVDIIQS